MAFLFAQHGSQLTRFASYICPQIKRRQVFVHGGYAFVPRDRVLELVVTRFRMRVHDRFDLVFFANCSCWHKRPSRSRATKQLSKSLALANKLWPRVATDVRIAPLLKNIGKQYLGRDYLSQVKASGQVTPDQLNVVRYTPIRCSVVTLRHHQ